MKKKPIYAVIGTRAQLIKMAPVLREMQDNEIEYTFIYTAQHRETIEELLSEFGIRQPDIDLSEHFKEEAKTIGLFAGWLWKMGLILLFQRREMIKKSGGIVITHGDTTTTVWGAILGKLTGNRVMHIESGLRSFNILKPFPEELNRLITFRFTDIFACPGEWAVENVKKYKGQVINTQVNTLYDATQLAISKKNKYKKLIPKDKYVIASIHRFENIFNKPRFLQIMELLEDIAMDFIILFVLHPATKKQLEKENLIESLKQNKNIQLKPRMPYVEFVNLLDSSEFVITDGGSNQEELSYLGKPTLLIRKATERKEGLGENVILSGLKKSMIEKFLDNYKQYSAITNQEQKYSPSKMIVEYLIHNL